MYFHSDFVVHPSVCDVRNFRKRLRKNNCESCSVTLVASLMFSFIRFIHSLSLHAVRQRPLVLQLTLNFTRFQSAAGHLMRLAIINDDVISERSELKQKQNSTVILDKKPVRWDVINLLCTSTVKRV